MVRFLFIGTAPYGSARSLFLKPEHTVIWASGPVYYPQAEMRRRRISAPLAAICQYAAIPDQTQRLFLIFFLEKEEKHQVHHKSIVNLVFLRS